MCISFITLCKCVLLYVLLILTVIVCSVFCIISTLHSAIFSLFTLLNCLFIRFTLPPSLATFAPLLTRRAAGRPSRSSLNLSSSRCAPHRRRAAPRFTAACWRASSCSRPAGSARKSALLFPRFSRRSRGGSSRRGRKQSWQGCAQRDSQRCLSTH